MTDGESPSTVFRLQDVCGHCLYTESRSVIIKDAWTKKHMFIVSINRILQYVVSYCVENMKNMLCWKYEK